MKFPTSGGIANHMVAYTRASKGPHGEGAMESHDREESMASMIIHHHMEPSFGGDDALEKAEIWEYSGWIQGDQKQATTHAVQDSYDRMKP